MSAGKAHRHENTKTVVNRLSRAIGHLEAVKKMVEEDRDCSEVLIQISAVKSAVNNIGKLILQDHLNHCVAEAVSTGDNTELKKFSEAIDKFIK